MVVSLCFGKKKQHASNGGKKMYLLRSPAEKNTPTANLPGLKQKLLSPGT